MSVTRLWLVFRRELSQNVRRVLFWVWVVLVVYLAFGLSKGQVRIQSGDSSVGGAKSFITSEFAVSWILAIMVPLVYGFFVSVLSGMAVIHDDECRVGELLHATPLRASEYIWGKFLAGLATATLVLAFHVSAMMLFNHGTPSGDVAEFPGTAPGRQLRPGRDDLRVADDPVLRRSLVRGRLGDAPGDPRLLPARRGVPRVLVLHLGVVPLVAQPDGRPRPDDDRPGGVPLAERDPDQGRPRGRVLQQQADPARRFARGQPPDRDRDRAGVRGVRPVAALRRARRPGAPRRAGLAVRPVGRPGGDGPRARRRGGAPTSAEPGDDFPAARPDRRRVDGGAGRAGRVTVEPGALPVHPLARLAIARAQPRRRRRVRHADPLHLGDVRRPDAQPADDRRLPVAAVLYRRVALARVSNEARGDQPGDAAADGLAPARQRAGEQHGRRGDRVRPVPHGGRVPRLPGGRADRDHAVRARLGGPARADVPALDVVRDVHARADEEPLRHLRDRARRDGLHRLSPDRRRDQLAGELAALERGAVE